jgi:alcohol dehydrogenase
MIDKYADVATAFGVRDPTLTPLENAHRAIDAIGQLSIQIGTAKSIEMCGGSEKDIPELTTRALKDICLFTNAIPASRADIEQIFRASMSNPVLYPPTPAKL